MPEFKTQVLNHILYLQALIQTYMCACVFVCIYKYVRIYLYMYLCVYICVYVCIDIDIGISAICDKKQQHRANSEDRVKQTQVSAV